MIKKLLLSAVFIGLIIALRNSTYAEMLTFENLKANADALKTTAGENIIKSGGIYLFIYLAVTGLNIPGAAVLSITAGYLFGAFTGTFLAVTGATAGAAAAMLFSRYMFGGYINIKYDRQLAKFNKELSENGYLYMLTLRLIPVFPFFIINILAGLTRIKLTTFIWTSFIGMIPGGFVFVYAGSRLNEIQSPKDIISPGMLSAFALIGFLVLMPVIYKKIKVRR